MKYLCIVYQSDKGQNALPKKEEDALVQECIAYTRQLAKQGKCLASNALEPASMAVTIRVRQGRIGATDGPFAETKEQVAGYLLIEADDLDEAVKLARGWPPLRLGSVEIRPVRELPLDKACYRTLDKSVDKTLDKTLDQALDNRARVAGSPVRSGLNR